MIALCAIGGASLVGCSTTQNLGDSKLGKSQLATIEVASKHGSGRGASSSQVRYVDGVGIADNAAHATVEPGYHTISFDFEQVLEVGGKFRLSLDLFGNESDLVKPQEGSSIRSTNPIEVRENLAAGKTYYADISSLGYKPAPLSEFEERMRNALGDQFSRRYLLTGSAFVREKK